MKYQKFVMVGAGLALSLALTACGGAPQQDTQRTQNIKSVLRFILASLWLRFPS